MLVPKDKFPNIVEAFHAIDEDNSGPQALRLPIYTIPDSYEPYIHRIETVIGSLSRKDRAPTASPLPAHVKPHEFLDSEFSAFVAGEYSEMEEITNRSFNHTLGNILLNEYFEDFTEPLDPYQEALRRRIQFLESVGNKEEADKLRLEVS